MANRSNGRAEPSAGSAIALTYHRTLIGLFQSLDSFDKLKDLIDNGEAEGAHVECKAPTEPRLSRDLKAQLAEAASGFANTGSGVIIWGMSTTKHAHSGLDLLTQIEPIGNCRALAQQVDLAIPTITNPVLQVPPSRVILPERGATKGVVVTYIPTTPGDPVQSLVDRRFYLRTGDQFVEMPYEVLKRMFVGTTGPDLIPRFDGRLVRRDPDGVWRIPIVLENRSSAVGEYVKVSVEVLNPDACQEIKSQSFDDASDVNPGRRLFILDVEGRIHRGLDNVVGSLLVSMKKGKRPKRVVSLGISVYASRMRARHWTATVQVAKKGFSVKRISDEYLY